MQVSTGTPGEFECIFSPSPHLPISPSPHLPISPSPLMAELAAIKGVEQLANCPKLWHHSQLRLSGTKL
ncbi:hypothetical protein [Microseira sp. BLCC-F43]|uniref:hypothetical protein n=1 Tax=Microseira sp. BLCC-F43 TaxID=3153602 RepID=UPI0035B7EA8A